MRKQSMPAEERLECGLREHKPGFAVGDGFSEAAGPIVDRGGTRFGVRPQKQYNPFLLVIQVGSSPPVQHRNQVVLSFHLQRLDRRPFFVHARALKTLAPFEQQGSRPVVRTPAKHLLEMDDRA